jgi:glycosyltransferase involved in cell wall biosynthesis
MRLSVLIPTYRRADDLQRCLEALAVQQRPADEVVIVRREEDLITADLIEYWRGRLPISTVIVSQPGVVHALNEGKSRTSGDVICITDDDSSPHPDWLSRIEAHFLQDPQLGGLGGRDHIFENGHWIEPASFDVGRIHSFGRISGNHHQGLGRARIVDHLKGVNMAWRTSAIGSLRFDESLRGKGAQVYFELAFSLAIARARWLLKYDPDLVVDHFPGTRFDSDIRGYVNLEAAENASYNFYWSLLHYMSPGPRRWTALSWERLIGSGKRPGFTRFIAARLRGNTQSINLYRVAQRARRDAREAQRARLGLLA